MISDGHDINKLSDYITSYDWGMPGCNCELDKGGKDFGTSSMDASQGTEAEILRLLSNTEDPMSPGNMNLHQRQIGKL